MPTPESAHLCVYVFSILVFSLNLEIDWAAYYVNSPNSEDNSHSSAIEHSPYVISCIVLS
jgi:hypothetical protein